MAETKTKAAVETKTTTESVQKDKELQKQLEEAAMRRVAAAMGVDYDDVLATEKRKKDDEQMVEVDLGPFTVSVNGLEYRGKAVVKKSLGEVLISLAANKKMRILNEQIGRKHEVISLATGGFSSRTIGTVTDSDALVAGG
jgi:hypothetical protein